MEVRNGEVLCRLHTTRRKQYVTIDGVSHLLAVGQLYGSKGYGVVVRQTSEASRRYRLLSGPWPTSARAMVEYGNQLDALTLRPSIRSGA